MKVSTHVRAAITAAIIVFVGYVVKEPHMVSWLSSHWLVSDAITGAGLAWGVYNTYSQPQDLSSVPPVTK